MSAPADTPHDDGAEEARLGDVLTLSAPGAVYFAVWDDSAGNALCWPCGHEMKMSNGRKITPWSSSYSTNP